jgi:hypothetical protein
MQRFTVIHDGSDQGWQAVYLAFHIAAQLGAPLVALLIGSTSDKKILAQNASQVKVGGHAAGVVIDTQLVTKFSVEAVKETVTNSDGLFVPRRLIIERNSAAHFLQALSKPLWIVSKETAMHKMAVLVEDLVADKALIDYTKILSGRIQQSLTGLVRADAPAMPFQADASIAWMSLLDFSAAEIIAALQQLKVGLLFIPFSRIALVNQLLVNCVVFPVKQDA